MEHVYTVDNLIEDLKKCPRNYEVLLVDPESSFGGRPVDTLAIDHKVDTVYIFAE